jgi:O-antigen ligase
MKKEISKPIPGNRIPLRWIFGGLIAVTLFFQTTLVDPFNSPKSWILLITAAGLSGHLLNIRTISQEIPLIKKLTYLVLLFCAGILNATIFSDSYYISVFGDTLRKNGLLSYFSLAVIMLASAIFVRMNNVKILFKVTVCIAVVTVFYAFLQTTGNDFVEWNNPYNPVITTVGNPNFAAALMAVMGALIFSTVWNSAFTFKFRLAGAVLCLLLLLAIDRSNARQGLLSYAIGIGAFLIILLWIKNRWLGIISLLIGSVIVFFSILGMLQIGPLEKFLYKGSVTIRGYYWKTGIEMFQSNPFTGVGMDRYGSYFKQYRESKYSLNHGFEITSTNAHNTFIQFFATGGLLLGLAYLILNLFILKQTYTALKVSKGANRLLIAGVFSGWITFHAQSLVSIDNLGISIWVWVLGGSLIGLSASAQEPISKAVLLKRAGQNSVSAKRALLSGGSTLFSLVLVALLYRSEVVAYQSMMTYDLQNEQSRNSYRDINLQVIDNKLSDPQYKLRSSINLIQAGFGSDGLDSMKNLLLADPRNLDTLNSLASLYEQKKEFALAVKIREQIIILDPWNGANYLAAGKNYKQLGDLDKSRQMLDKILSFASNHPIAEQAKIELAN